MLGNMPSPATIPNTAAGFLSFVNKSPTPFHVVATASELLTKAGFAKISERDDFAAKLKEGELVKGGKYFYTRSVGARLS